MEKKRERATVVDFFFLGVLCTKVYDSSVAVLGGAAVASVIQAS